MLIVFRALQGLGGGMLMPLGMTIMTRAAGPQRMGRLMAILGVPMLLGPIVGPILGGYLIDNYSWHWIFLINLPLGIIALVYAWACWPDRPGALGVLRLRRHGPDVPGSGALPVRRLLDPGRGHDRLPQGPHRRHPRAGSSWRFVFYSFRPEHPLLDLRLFKNRKLTVSMITMFLFAAAFFGGLLLVPTYFQQVRGESPLHAGCWWPPRASARCSPCRSPVR